MLPVAVNGMLSDPCSFNRLSIDGLYYSPTEYCLLPVPVMEYNMIRVLSTDCLMTVYSPTAYCLLPVPAMEYNMIRVVSTDCL